MLGNSESSSGKCDETLDLYGYYLLCNMLCQYLFVSLWATLNYSHFTYMKKKKKKKEL